MGSPTAESLGDHTNYYKADQEIFEQVINKSELNADTKKSISNQKPD